MRDWIPDLSQNDKPRYIAIADIIAGDIKSGRLNQGDRLPPQRKLAQKLDLDFTTVARGYVEAQKRGLVESRVGQGTYVLPQTPPPSLRPSTRTELVDLSMNLPPEPNIPELIARMNEGYAEVGRDLVGLLRYQGFGGSRGDKDAASAWLSRRGMVPSQERIFVTPGAHPAISAILALLAKPGETVLCEALTYPGVRSISAQLGLRLLGLPMDDDGIDPDALAQACETQAPKALYLNPTLQNPTTLTIPAARRAAIAKVARRYRLPIVEDDAYGFIPLQGPPPLASIAPDITWHIAGLAKCIGAGLRAAYVVVPDARSGWPFAAALRASTVMALALDGRARDTLDRGRHGGFDPPVHSHRNGGASETRARTLAAGELPRGCDEFQSLGSPAETVDAFGFYRPYALAADRHRRERRVHGVGGARRVCSCLSRRTRDSCPGAQRARIHGPCLERIAGTLFDISLMAVSGCPRRSAGTGTRAPLLRDAGNRRHPEQSRVTAPVIIASNATISTVRRPRQA